MPSQLGWQLIRVFSILTVPVVVIAMSGCWPQVYPNHYPPRHTFPDNAASPAAGIRESKVMGTGQEWALLGTMSEG